MLNIGEYNQMEVVRKVEIGYFLKELDGDTEVLMPNNCVRSGEMQAQDIIQVFVYKDHENRLIATEEEPFGKVGDYVTLEVADVNKAGAFMDWGLTKQLLVPFSEQRQRMEVGEHHVVRIVLDARAERPVGTAKLNAFLNRADDVLLEEGEEVEALIYASSELGYSCIVNQTWRGLLYKNEAFQPLKIGEKYQVFVKKVREDNLIDLSLKKGGYVAEEIEGDAQMLLGEIISRGGVLPFSDKASPEQIKEELQMSKKHFKKVVGYLYKKGLIVLSKDSIAIK
ncbi:CvfB family protein [Algivirga pacifica]|uniref:S1-like domain-containing RNA-binding protein n=1 Tax=Algivirga pacifica TaxID=1162670 RepID=A0ABP9D004_9BACT